MIIIIFGREVTKLIVCSDDVLSYQLSQEDDDENKHSFCFDTFFWRSLDHPKFGCMGQGINWESRVPSGNWEWDGGIMEAFFVNKHTPSHPPLIHRQSRETWLHFCRSDYMMMESEGQEWATVRGERRGEPAQIWSLTLLVCHRH